MQINLFLKSSFLAVFILIAPLASAASAEWRAEAAATLPASGEIYLGLFNNGERDGFMRLGWTKSERKITLYDRSMLPSGELYETQETIVSMSDLSPERINIRFHQGSFIGYWDILFSGGAARGERRFARPGNDDQVIPIEVGTLPTDLTPRITSFVMPLVLAQEAGATVDYHWYAPLGNKVEAITLTARHSREIETPAGKFDTVLFELRGGTPENDIYVSLEHEPRIVRIDVLGQPFQFLAMPPASEEP